MSFSFENINLVSVSSKRVPKKQVPFQCQKYKYDLLRQWNPQNLAKILCYLCEAYFFSKSQEGEFPYFGYKGMCHRIG